MDKKIVRKRIIKGCIALILASGLGYVTYLRATEQEAEMTSIEAIEREEGKSVTVANPQEKEFAEYITADATLRAPNRFPLRANISEKVSDVLVDIGDEVDEGDLMVEFRKTDIESDITAARTRLKEVERNYERFTSLLERGVVSQDTVDARLTALQDARSALRKAKSRMEFTQVKAPSRPELDYSAGNVQVSARNVDPGEFMGAGQHLITLTDMSTLDVEATVPEGMVKYLSIGRTIEFKLEHEGKWREAQIQRISPETADPHRFFTVYARTENQKNGDIWLLRPGMYAEVRIPKAESQTSMALPGGALRISEDACCSVFSVLYDESENSGHADYIMGTIEEIKIESGLRYQGWVQVISPDFSGGEHIVINPRLDLEDGDKVKVFQNTF